MAEVWSGIHARERVPVAVKLVTEPEIRRPAFHASLRNEVRAMARLEHPGIVMVFDHGEVTREAEEHSEGRLRAGTPYLVMELANQGTALMLCGRLPWRNIKRVLVSLLKAMAHAHARGVIHRDIKPSNVLVFDGEVKLSDFGLAIDLEPEGGTTTRRGRVLGTPAYMAPEQFVADWREYGPPTDLYALGCLAYALVCGAPPYGRGHDLTLMYEMHLEAVVPCLDPRMPVPEGFEAWLNRLMEKKPSRRYQRAADALEALLSLGDPPHDMVPLAEGMGAHAPIPSSVVTVPSDVEPAVQRAVRGGLDSVPPPGPAPQVPKTWRRKSDSPRRSMDLLGAGLGLFGSRPVPLVAREMERDTLWNALRWVGTRGTARLVVLDGPAGCGKSRLAQWLCERSHEVGAATVLKGGHGPRVGPADGLAPMIARFLRSEELERPELTRFIARKLARIGIYDGAEAAALAELVEPDPEEVGTRRVRFAAATERYVLVARLLRTLATQRPVVMWLDDVQWSLDTLSFVHHLLFNEESFPLLVVATVRSDVLAERREEERRLSACIGYERAEALHVGPLPEEEWPALVERLLRLDTSLAARIAERTKGNPLFAVQLVGHWVDRGLLEAGPEGFHLAPGASVELPDELHGMWSDRVERLLAGRPEPEVIALELAAALGEAVNGEDWAQVCSVAGVETPAGLVEDLLARRLAYTDDRGPTVSWFFVHGMLRETLELHAQDRGRAEANNRACAEMLRGRRGQGIAERLANHLVAAGELAEALGPLRDAISERLETGDYGMADALLAERDAALVELRSTEGSEEWCEDWILRGRLAASLGRFEVGLEWATLALRTAEENGWSHLGAEALMLRARLNRLRGSADKAETDVKQARRLAQTGGQQRLHAEALKELGRLLMHKGELEKAGKCLREMLALCEEAGDRRGVAQALWSLAHQESYLRDYELASAHNQAALEDLRQLGDRWGTARCLVTAGELARLRQDPAEAERCYREARDIVVAIGAVDAVAICESNVARVLAEAGRYDEAREQLERSRPKFVEQGRRDPLAWLYIVLLVCDAGEQRWEDWDAHWSEADKLLAETRYLDLDIATVAQMAGALAEERGRPIRARQAYLLARHQWEALGRQDEAAAVCDALDALGVLPH